MITCRRWWTSPSSSSTSGAAEPGRGGGRPGDMTRLTLDTIALCGFGYRFNSFYRDTPHPFVQAMVRTLSESQARARQLPIQTRLKIRAQRQVEEDQAFMDDLVDRLIAERRAQGDAGDTTDLLGRMLTGVDRQTGEWLPDSNIRAQCITFLIAGHETTSGLLSFALYYLLKNPAFLERARGRWTRSSATRPVPPSSRCTGSPTCGRSSTSPCGCGRPHRASTATRSRTPSSAAATPSRRTRASRCSPRPCTARRPCGDRTRRTSTLSTWPPNGWQRCLRRSTSRSGPGSAPASGGSSRCRRRRWCSGCSSSAST